MGVDVGVYAFSTSQFTVTADRAGVTAGVDDVV